MGSLCAFMPNATPHKIRQPLSLIGLALILFSIFTYTEQMRLPSLYALAPVLGTALILYCATTGTWVAHILSLRPMVGIGLISYSAYLWHQPLFALMRIRSNDLLNATDKTLLIAVSLLLAAITWRLVEQPFRVKNHRHYITNRPALIMAIIAVASITGAGIYGHITHGRLADWEKFVPANQARAYALFRHTRSSAQHHFNEMDDNGNCKFRTSTINKNINERLTSCYKQYGPGIALIGDSQAVNTYFIAKATAKRHPFIIGISKVACRVHEQNPDCYYKQFTALLKTHPKLFSDIIYEQSGTYLIGDGIGAHDIEKLPLDAHVPNVEPHLPNIDKVGNYLGQLKPYARITWYGPRVEPQIREKVMIQLGCDYPYQFRPNQNEIYAKLDTTLARRMAARGIRYRSQQQLINLDLSRDLMTCDDLYFVDKTHYSIEGEARFAKRAPLSAILN